MEGHEAVVRILIARREVDLEDKDKDGQTPLSRAVESGREAVVKLLLNRGADLETKDRYSQTPLSRAARSGHEVVVKLLLNRGACIKMILFF